MPATSAITVHATAPNPEEARATRRRVLEHCAEHSALLFPVVVAAGVPRLGRSDCGCGGAPGGDGTRPGWEGEDDGP